MDGHLSTFGGTSDKMAHKLVDASIELHRLVRVRVCMCVYVCAYACTCACVWNPVMHVMCVTVMQLML